MITASPGDMPSMAVLSISENKMQSECRKKSYTYRPL